MTRAALVLVLVLVLVAGCGKGEQSYREGMELFCESPTKIPDGRNRLGDAIQAVVPKIKNKQTIELLERLPQVEGGEKLPMLRMGVKEAGLTRCTVLEVWEEQVKNPPKLPPDPLAEPVPPAP